MTFTIDVPTERHFRHTDPDRHAAWWQWLTDTLGQDPAGMKITAVTLGEGYIDVERFEQPYRIIGDEVARYVTRIPAPHPPPCWLP